MNTKKKEEVQKKKKEGEEKGIVYLVKWGSSNDDPIKEFSELEKAKKLVIRLINDGEEAQHIRIYKVLVVLKPVISFENLK